MSWTHLKNLQRQRRPPYFPCGGHWQIEMATATLRLFRRSSGGSARLPARTRRHPAGEREKKVIRQDARRSGQDGRAPAGSPAKGCYYSGLRYAPVTGGYWWAAAPSAPTYSFLMQCTTAPAKSPGEIHDNPSSESTSDSGFSARHFWISHFPGVSLIGPMVLGAA